MIQREVKDPRIGMVTINEAKVSRDLAFSDVYFTVLGSDDRDEINEAEAVEVERVLNQASGFLRSRLAKVLETRSTPRLRFHYDNTTQRGAKLERAIDAALAKDNFMNQHQEAEEARQE